MTNWSDVEIAALLADNDRLRRERDSYRAAFRDCRDRLQVIAKQMSQNLREYRRIEADMSALAERARTMPTPEDEPTGMWSRLLRDGPGLVFVVLSLGALVLMAGGQP